MMNGDSMLFKGRSKVSVVGDTWGAIGQMGGWCLIHKRYKVRSAQVLREVFDEDAQKAYSIGSLLCPLAVFLCPRQ